MSIIEFFHEHIVATVLVLIILIGAIENVIVSKNRKK